MGSVSFLTNLNADCGCIRLSLYLLCSPSPNNFPRSAIKKQKILNKIMYLEMMFPLDSSLYTFYPMVKLREQQKVMQKCTPYF